MRVISILFMSLVLSACAADFGKNKNEEVSSLTGEVAALKVKLNAAESDLRDCRGYSREIERGRAR